MILNKILYLFIESFKSILRAIVPSIVSSLTIAVSLVVLSISFYFYNNLKTYTSELKNEYMQLKMSKSKRKIGNQFEYNQFTRDFFATNPGLTRQDCLKCWKRVREQKDRKYSDECLVFLR